MAGELKPEDHVGLLFWVAGRLSGKYRSTMDELVSHGAAGLIRGCETFDPNRGTARSTYLEKCIRTSILDGVRQFDYGVPLIAPPIAARRGWGVYKGMPVALMNRSVLDSAAVFGSDVADARAIAAEQRNVLLREIRELPRMLRLVLLLRFFRGMDGQQVAKRIGKTRERVRQLIGEGIERLRKPLREEDFF